MADKLSRYILEKYLWQAETYKKTSSVLSKNSLKNKQKELHKSGEQIFFDSRKEFGNNKEISLYKNVNSKVWEMRINDDFFDVEDVIKFKRFLNVLAKELLKRLQEKKNKQTSVQNKTQNIDGEKYVIIDEENVKPVFVELPKQQLLKEMLEGEFKIVEDEQKPQDIKNEKFVIVDDEDEENDLVITDMFEWNGERYKVYEDVTKFLTKRARISDYFLPGSSTEEKKVNHFLSKLITAVEREFNKQYNVSEQAKIDKAKNDEKKAIREELKARSKLRMQKLREDLNAEKDELNFEKK